MNKKEIKDSITVFFEDNKVGLLVVLALIGATCVFFYFYYFAYIAPPSDVKELRGTVEEYFTFATKNGIYQKVIVKIEYNGLVDLENNLAMPDLKKGDEVIILELISEKGGKKYRFLQKL